MEVYQWLLRQRGFKVSNTGYFVYANAKKDRKAFDAKLEFEVTLIAYTGNDSWIEGTLAKIKKCLDSEEIPKSGNDCDYCTYREAAAKALMTQHGKNATPAVRSKKVESQESTLFS